jgi:hypothetical protein
VNLPAGSVIKTDVDVASVDFIGLLKELKGKVFNGYLCIAVKGKTGFEEGVIVFDNGKVEAVAYDYLAFNKGVVGSKALARVINASSAKLGVIDIFQLTNEQVQLIIAFNEQAIVVPSEDELRRLKTEVFSNSFEDEITGGKEAETESDLLKKYKLSSVKVEKKEDEDELKKLLG